MSREALLNKLTQHAFFKCHTGQCIAKFISDKLVGTEKIVCVTAEEKPGKYWITVQNGASTICTPPFDHKVVVYTVEDISGSFDVNSLKFDVKKTRFSNYSDGITLHMAKIVDGSVSFMINDEEGTLQVPSIMLTQVKITLTKSQ